MGIVYQARTFQRKATSQTSQVNKARKKFRALKRIPIRGYCWLSETHKNTYFISHYVAKKKNKLDQSDTDKVQANWRRIEVDGDDC